MLPFVQAAETGWHTEHWVPGVLTSVVYPLEGWAEGLRFLLSAEASGQVGRMEEHCTQALLLLRTG